mmetsp:Transcript_9701/g.10207  ORF Transcript_9701/g.10207 Transcript_9701/m.10207 type:complete len:97 (-) Transcript_9701:232-522(-)
MFPTIRKTISKQINKSFLSSSSTVRDGVFKPKTTLQVWTGDAGAYPIMVGIGWCIFFGASFSVYYATSSPDVRLWGESRRKLFRGEMSEYTRNNIE